MMTNSESTNRLDEASEATFDRAVQLLANDSVSTEAVERVKNRAIRLNETSDNLGIVNAISGTQEERPNRRRLRRMTGLSAVALLLLVPSLTFANRLSQNKLYDQLIASLKGLQAFVSVNWFASQSPNATTETLIGQGQLIVILQLPPTQKELNLTDEQLAKIAEIRVNPANVTFSQAIAPLKSILTDDQMREFKRIAFQGLMVRAFSVPEVRDSLDLTPEQIASITAIQAELRVRLQPFQDKVTRQENVDPLELDRDTATFHREAYVKAIELLTCPQREIWEEIARPVPLRNDKGEK